MSKRENTVKIVCLCVILILVLVVLYGGLRILESTIFSSGEGQGDAYISKTIVRDGVEYFPRQDIMVMMILGIDRYGVAQPSGSYNNTGDADMITLLIFDKTNHVYHMLHLNRDTMLDIPVLGIGGKQAGTIYAQLTLAHTYGSGMKDSCDNVKKTLEMFIPGLTIDYYISARMDAISIMNDSVGGVTVNIVDDFSDVDPTMTKGELTLTGQQVLYYVRARKDVGDQKNVTRMERQKEYMEKFLEKFHEKVENQPEYMLQVYEDVSPYLVTDCSLTTMNSILQHYSNYELGQVYTLEGDNVIGEKYYEFYVDEAALDALALELFYAPKK